MSKISIDTTKLKASGESIVSIAEEFNSIIEDIFTKLKSMDANGTWTGDSESSAVKKYIERISKEKEQYSNYAIAIRKLGNEIITYADKMNSVSNNKIKEGLCQK